MFRSTTTATTTAESTTTTAASTTTAGKKAYVEYSNICVAFKPRHKNIGNVSLCFYS